MGRLPGEEPVAGGPLTQVLAFVPVLELGRGVASAPAVKRAAVAERRMVRVLSIEEGAILTKFCMTGWWDGVGRCWPGEGGGVVVVWLSSEAQSRRSLC